MINPKKKKKKKKYFNFFNYKKIFIIKNYLLKKK